MLGFFSGSLFSEGLIIGRNFSFQNGLGLDNKTASTNSPWAYIWEGLLSEGFLRLRFGGGGGLFSGGLIIEGAYYRNFTVFHAACACQTTARKSFIDFNCPETKM